MFNKATFFAPVDHHQADTCNIRHTQEGAVHCPFVVYTRELWLYSVASAAFISCALTVLIMHKWTSRWMRCAVSQVHACGNYVFTKLQYMFSLLTHLKSEDLQSKFQLRYQSVISNDSGLLHVGELTCGADLHFRVPSLFSSVPALCGDYIYI